MEKTANRGSRTRMLAVEIRCLNTLAIELLKCNLIMDTQTTKLKIRQRKSDNDISIMFSNYVSGQQ